MSSLQAVYSVNGIATLDVIVRVVTAKLGVWGGRRRGARQHDLSVDDAARHSFHGTVVA